MKRTGFPRAVLAAIAAAILIADLVVLAPPAAAQVTVANGALGLIRVISAINRRNQIYQAARDTQRDFNAYYNSLRDTARAQLVSGELDSLRHGETGLEPVRAAAYIRLTAALAQEQAAVTRAIDAETNQARRDFNRTLVRQLQEVVIRLPGAQQILGEVRTVISNLRTTVIALQTAAAANQPLDVLTQRLAEQVSSSSIIQDRVRELGSALGPDLDQALGGALTQVNNTLQDVNREANQAVVLLDGMEGQVAALDLSQAEVAEGDTTCRAAEYPPDRPGNGRPGRGVTGDSLPLRDAGHRRDDAGAAGPANPHRPPARTERGAPAGGTDGQSDHVFGRRAWRI